MRVLVDSYNLVTQNPSGGVKVRIENYIRHIEGKIEIKRFDKWVDRVDEYDLVHIFKSSSESWTMMKYAHSKGIPVVVSSVVPSEKRLAIWLNRLLCSKLPVYSDRYMNELVLKNADAIIAQTEIEKQFIAKNFRICEKKIYVIPNGVSLDLEREISADYFFSRTGIEGKYILQVGRFDENKNQLSVIEAVKDTDMQLVFIGGADKECPEYYEICKSLAGKNIRFLGWVDHNDILLQAAYRNAQVVILPSHKEIFGNSLFEGGACGANLVASKVLPINEWGLSEWCSTIDPKNIADIKNKLQKMYEDDKNNLLSEFIVKNFSWEAVTDKYIEIYRNLLNT